MELNPTWDQRRLRAFCKERGVHITAYSPLGANGAPWGSLAVMQSPVLKEIAAARGKSLPNVWPIYSYSPVYFFTHYKIFHLLTKKKKICDL